MGKKSLFKSTTGVSAKKQLVSLTLNRLQPNQWNTKAKDRYSGQAFDELIESIKSKGLLQPILVRPVKKKKTVDHEIVCGERRFKAVLSIAGKNGGPAKNTILCLVRKLSDDEAFDLTIVENLQRQDLNPLEEAQAFKRFLQKHGDDAAEELADRINCSASYIRRRVAVLNLPKPALKAWQRGQASYGHLEQLRRLKDKKQIARFVGRIIARSEGKDAWDQPMTVRELKHNIDMESPTLKKTLFDKRKAGCAQCFSNSNVQKVMFEDGDDENIKCLDPKCYKQQVNNYLSANWKKEFKPKYGTNGFRFESSVSYDDYEGIYSGRIKAACKKCESLVTLVLQDGQERTKRACVGDKACYKKNYSRKKTSAGGSADDPQTKAANRAKNHGIEFRELFYSDVLPQRFSALAANDEKVLQSTIIAYYVAAGWETGRWIIEQLGLDEETYFGDDEICGEVFKLTKEQARDLLQKLTLHSLMTSAGPGKRRAVADHIGIDLAAEWIITEAYLKKKTIAELIAIGQDHNIFESQEVDGYMAKAFGREGDDIRKLKKAELIKVFLESGVDLAGKVPDEILQ